MKPFFGILFLLLTGPLCYAQHVYQIRADSVRIYNTCDTAELILENRTQKVPGFLFNKGDGRTEFRKLKLGSPAAGSLSILGQDTINLSGVLAPWGDGRYDLLSTNFVTIQPGDSMLWTQWYPYKTIGYFAYASLDMPTLSAQAFSGAGSNSYYNGMVMKTGSTGFDFAVNWNGELLGPNGAFIRIKDDTKDKWSKWRELLFKDYADKSYVSNQKSSPQVADLWISGVAKIGDSVLLSRYPNNASGDSLLTTDINGRLKLVPRDIPGKWLPVGTTTSGIPEGSNLYWTTARGDARYPLLSGAYANPSWLTSLPWSKITGTPTTLAGYGITDAAPATGGTAYIGNQLGVQASANFNISGFGTASGYSATQPVANGGTGFMMFEGTTAGGSFVRWGIRRMNAEAAGDVGNDFTIDRYSNTGGAYGSAFSIKRSTGIVNMPNGATMGNKSAITGTNAGTANLSYLQFNDFNGTRSGYVGKGSNANSDIYLLSDAGNVTLMPTGGTGYLNVQPASMLYNGGQFSLNNGASNLISYSNFGLGAPTFTNRSLGTKAAWYSSTSATTVDFATGIESGAMWNSVPNSSTSYAFKWYGGTTPVSVLNAVGNQSWIGSGVFRGWNAGAGGPAAEIGVPGGYALFAGIDRTSGATYMPTTIRGGSGSGDGAGKDFTIDGAGYKLTGLLNATTIGTNASGYLVNTSSSFAPATGATGYIQNGTNAQSGANFNIAGSGVIGSTLTTTGLATFNGALKVASTFATPANDGLGLRYNSSVGNIDVVAGGNLGTLALNTAYLVVNTTNGAFPGTTRFSVDGTGNINMTGIVTMGGGSARTTDAAGTTSILLKPSTSTIQGSIGFFRYNNGGVIGAIGGQGIASSDMLYTASARHLFQSGTGAQFNSGGSAPTTVEVVGSMSAYGYKNKEGVAGATMGLATVASGATTVVVSTSAVTANSRIFLTCQSGTPAPVVASISARSAGTSFTIAVSTSTGATVAWMIVEPY